MRSNCAPPRRWLPGRCWPGRRTRCTGPVMRRRRCWWRSGGRSRSRAARQYCLVGAATAPRRSLTGEVLPPSFPILADAVSARRGLGERGAGGGDRPRTRKAATACSLADLQSGNGAGAARAEPDRDRLRALAGHVRDQLDQDGVLPREQRQQQRRSLTISTTSDGMIHLDWYLNPESAATCSPPSTRSVGHELRQVRFHDRPPIAETKRRHDLPESGVRADPSDVPPTCSAPRHLHRHVEPSRQ